LGGWIVSIPFSFSLISTSYHFCPWTICNLL
jgi:hypothetical protein